MAVGATASIRYEADAGSWVNMPAVRLDSVDTGVSLFWPQAT